MPSIISPTGRALQAEIAKLAPDQAMAKINQGVGLVPFPELLAMKMQMDRMKKAAPPQQGKASTVADDMKQQMSGLAGLPTNPGMFQQEPQHMAGGGIVAFASGGLTAKQVAEMNAGDYSDPDVQAYIASQRQASPSYSYSYSMPTPKGPGFAEGGAVSVDKNGRPVSGDDPREMLGGGRTLYPGHPDYDAAKAGKPPSQWPTHIIDARIRALPPSDNRKAPPGPYGSHLTGFYAEGGITTPTKTDYGSNTYWDSVKDRIKELVGPHKVGKGMANNAAKDLSGAKQAIDKAVEDASMAAGGIVAFAQGGKAKDSSTMGEAYKHYLTDYFGLQPAFDAYDSTSSALGTVGNTLSRVSGFGGSPTQQAPAAGAPAPTGDSTLGQYDLWSQSHGGAQGASAPPPAPGPSSPPPPMIDPSQLDISVGGRGSGRDIPPPPSNAVLRQTVTDARAGLEQAKPGTRADYLAQMRKEYGDAGIGSAEADYQKVLDARAEELKGRSKQDKWMAAANGFFKMAEVAGQPGGTFLRGASAGAAEGGKEMQQAMQGYRTAKDNLQDAQYKAAVAHESVQAGILGATDKRYTDALNQQQLAQRRLDESTRALGTFDASVYGDQTRAAASSAYMRAQTQANAPYAQLQRQAYIYGQQADMAEHEGNHAQAAQLRQLEQDTLTRANQYNQSMNVAGVRAETGMAGVREKAMQLAQQDIRYAKAAAAGDQAGADAVIQEYVQRLAPGAGGGGSSGGTIDFSALPQ